MADYRLVDETLDRFEALASDRSFWETHWLDVAKYAIPDIDKFDALLGSSVGRAAAINAMSEPVTPARGREIYDQTSLMAVDRGANGFLSLVTPQSEKWHGLKLADPFSEEPSDEEQRWLDKVRDYLHMMRSNPATGFWVAHKAAMRGIWGLGTSVIFTEGSDRRGNQAPISYRSTPLSECYLSCDFEGRVDTNYRLFTLSARQMVMKFGADAVSQKVRDAANDVKRKDTTFEIIHAVEPRKDGKDGGTVKDARWRSVYVERASKHVVGGEEGGFFSFPYIVHHWNRTTQAPYSEGPLSLALAEIKSLNMLSKQALKAAQQAVSPAWGTIDDGINRLNLNPNAVNPGLVSKEGRLLAQPINGGTRPDFAESVLNLKREQIKETLYVNVWQILINNPGMTATEAMIRANEKGDLLGPAGNSIQVGLSNMIDREMDILERMGAFRPGSPLEPPASMAGQSISVRFTSPLDRLQMSSELTGAQRVIEVAGILAQAGKREALDRINADEVLDLAQEVTGAPRRILRSVEDMQEMRDQAAQAQQMAMLAQLAGQAGDAGQKVVGGMDAAAQSPALAGMMGGAA